MNKLFVIVIISLSPIFAALIHPPDGSEFSYIYVLFQWEEVEGANEYTFELSTTLDFEPILINKNVPDLYYMDQTNITWETTYYWRVRTDIEDENYIDTFSFTTAHNSMTFTSDDNPIEVITHVAEQAANGITVFGSYFRNYSAAIDMDGNEVWNSGGNNSFVFFNLNENNDFLGGKYSSIFSKIPKVFSFPSVSAEYRFCKPNWRKLER